MLHLPVSCAYTRVGVGTLIELLRLPSDAYGLIAHLMHTP